MSSISAKAMIGRRSVAIPVGGRAPVRLSTVAAGAFLLVLILFMAFGPLIAPSYSLNDYASGARHPEFDWRFLLGSDVLGRPILQYVILGARTTFGVALVGTVVAIVVGFTTSLLTRISYAQPVIRFIGELGLIIPALPLLLLLSAFAVHGNPWGLGLLMGIVTAPIAFWLLSTHPDASEPASVASLQRFLEPSETVRLARAVTLLLLLSVTLSVVVDFLGFGLPLSDPSWGNALSHVVVYLGFGYWWWLLFPGLVLTTTLVSIYTVGSAAVLALSRGRNGSEDARGSVL